MFNYRGFFIAGSVVVILGLLFVVGLASGWLDRQEPTPEPAPTSTPAPPTETPATGPTPIDPPMPSATYTSTPTPTPTDTPQPTSTPTLTPTPTATSTDTPTATPTPTPSVTPSATVPARPIAVPLPTMPLLPPNTCVDGVQQIRLPQDGLVIEAGRESLEILGAAAYPDSGQYQIDRTLPNMLYHDKAHSLTPVPDGELYRWNFEQETGTWGAGWYIVRLLVIDSVGNFAAIGPDGNNYGCHIRVYLPPLN